MASNMTVQTGVRPEDFLATVEPERRRRESYEMLDLMGRATGLEPRMWGPSIVGYGRYAYRYDSGHSGQSFLTGFSPRKAALTVYVMPGFDKWTGWRSSAGTSTAFRASISPALKKLTAKRCPRSSGIRSSG
jgi:hypothetical protein